MHSIEEIIICYELNGSYKLNAAADIWCLLHFCNIQHQKQCNVICI